MVESLKWGMSRRLVLAERSARRPGMSATRVAMKSASTAAGEHELCVWWHTVATYLAQQNNGEWIGLSSLNDKKFKSLKTTYLILTKFLQGVKWTFVGGLNSQGSQQIQDGGGRHFEFRKSINNSVLDKDICTKYYGKIHHGHEMTTWPKVETGSWSIIASLYYT